MGRSLPRRMALHRTGQTHAEWLHRKLQWAAAGAAAERDAVHVVGPGARCSSMLAGRLQRSTTSLAARVEDAVRIRLHLPSATGSGAALCRGLRASSRRYHRPTGQIQQPGRTQDWIKLGGKVSGTEVAEQSPLPCRVLNRRRTIGSLERLIIDLGYFAQW